MDTKPVRVALICGSVREGRFGPVVASWMRERVEARALRQARAELAYPNV
ncbi:hypothetical protein [Nocardia thraciensis]